ncbi:MAG TPA: signal peptidase I [Clostridia bacterium]|nr:signal peptidase I [Clostridia bacterium]
MGRWRRLFREWILPLGIAVLLSLTIRTFVAEARYIPSGSMIPTLAIDDRVFVDKIVFKYEGLERKDIIVFAPPEEAHAETDYIKRVIGLPGDLVEIKDGLLCINGEPFLEDYLLEAMEGSFGPVKVPEGKLFVLGDNRNYSSDSRVWGFVPLENVKGKAMVRIYPFHRFGKLVP